MRRLKLRSNLLSALFAALGLFCGAVEARAGAFEVQGLGPEGVADLGARAARADDGTAAFFNPGGLAFGEGNQVAVAGLTSISALEAQGAAQPLANPFGLTLALGSTIPFKGPLADRVRLGFLGHFVPQAALRLLSREGDRPFFPYYDNRTQRLVVLPALAFRITRRLGVGVGTNVLAGVAGPARLEDGATGAPEPRIDIVANTIMATVAGVRFDVNDHVRLGLVFRQSFGIPLRIETTANIGGVPLATDITSAQAMFDPTTLVIASSFELGRASFEIDAAYARWSAWEGPYLAVRSTLPGVNLALRAPARLFRDTVSAKVASSVPLSMGANSSLVLRASAGFEPTILKNTQQGRTNLVDGDKLGVGVGATLVWKNLVGKALRLGFGAQGHFLSTYSQDKIACASVPCGEGTVAGPSAANPSANIDNPGYPRLKGGGNFFTLSLGVGVDL